MMKDPFYTENDPEDIAVTPNGPIRNGFAPIYLSGPASDPTDLEWRTALGDEYDDIWWFDPAEELGHPVTGTDHDDVSVIDHRAVIETSAALFVGWSDDAQYEQTLTEMQFAHQGWAPVVVWLRDSSTVSPWIDYHSVFTSDDRRACVEFIEEVVIG